MTNNGFRVFIGAVFRRKDNNIISSPQNVYNYTCIVHTVYGMWSTANVNIYTLYTYIIYNSVEEEQQ